MLYSFVLNLVGMPFDVLFLPYLLLVILSAYTVILWRRKALGYVGGAGLLLAYVMLFSGLFPVLVFPALYDAAPIDVGGIVFILIIDIICLIPLVYFVRGIVSEREVSA